MPGGWLRGLEARWILPGPLGTALTGWFARFPATVEAVAFSLKAFFAVTAPRLDGLHRRAERDRRGIIVIVWPGPSLVTLALVLGIWLIIYGIMEITLAFRVRSAIGHVRHMVTSPS